jgi:serine/threonine-protein kinase
MTVTEAPPDPTAVLPVVPVVAVAERAAARAPERDGDHAPEAAPAPDPVLLPPQPVLFDDEASGGARRRGRVVGLVLAVVVLLGAGAGVTWWLWPRDPATHPVPNLVGLDEARAANQVAPFRWRIEVVEQKNDDVASGTVFRTEPALGVLAEGKPLVLYVSSGPTLSPLPELKLTTKDQAQALLDAQKLKLNVAGDAFDESVPAGAVVSWSVNNQSYAAGTQVVKGTVVDVVLSKGPQPRKVPALLGKSFDEASAALAGLQLTVQRVDDVFSDKYGAGSVAAIDPAAGTEVPRGTAVKVAVSKGQDLVVVPNVYGASLDLAAKQLTDAGLTFAVEGPTDKRVLEIAPVPGTQLKRGAQVKLKFA